NPPYCQQRIIREHRPHPYPDRIDLGAQAVGMPVGRSGRQPRPPSGRTRDAAIQARGSLQDDERPAFPDKRKKRLIEPNRRFRLAADLAVHSVCAQVGKALAPDNRIRILGRGYYPTDPGGHDPANAGSGTARMTAWLEGAVQGSTTRVTARHFERVDFRM